MASSGSLISSGSVGGLDAMSKQQSFHLPTFRGMMETQVKRYGKDLFERDSMGQQTCFFLGCGRKFFQNFGRHIQKHEVQGDMLNVEYVKTIVGPQAADELLAKLEDF